MPRSRIDIAAVKAYFDNRPEKVFPQSELFSLLSLAPAVHPEWNLPRSMTQQGFVDLLLHRTEMSKIELASADYPSLIRYAWSDPVPVLVALSIKRAGFLSHASAMWIHGIGDDENPIYVNVEQSPKPPSRKLLTQESIDRAFRSEQRQSRLIYKYRGTTIVILSGKNSGKLGVELFKTSSGEEVGATSLERTLVDIAVRPAYGGGIVNVLEAFRRSRGRVSAANLLRILKTLDYAYPYHQSIGLYMKLAGYEKDDQNLMRGVCQTFNFYLAHGSGDIAFDEDFKVFFPKSLK